MQMVFKYFITIMGAVCAAAGKDTVYQIMIAHTWAECVVRKALFISILIDSDIKVFLAQKKVIFHGSLPSPLPAAVPLE